MLSTHSMICLDKLLSDLDARRLASAWHGGQGTALYAFASTGAIDTARPDHDLDAELCICLAPASADLVRTIPGQSERTSVQLLRLYSRHHGPRGPQAHWHELVW